VLTKHAAEYNALSCAFGHHVAEGRWLLDSWFIDRDIDFWLGARFGCGPGLAAYADGREVARARNSRGSRAGWSKLHYLV